MKLPSYWKNDWFIGLVVTLLLLLLSVSDNLRSIEWWAYDLGVRFSSSRTANQDVILIAIDDDAILIVEVFEKKTQKTPKAT